MITNFVRLSEPKRTWRTQYPFLWLFYFNVFIASLSFAIILPSIWVYVEKSSGTNQFLALVLGVYSVGEVAGSLAFGCLYDCFSAKTNIITAMLVGLLGSLVYYIAGFLSDSLTLWMILLGRFMQGVWTGGEQAVEQAYIAEEVSENYRMRAINEVGVASLVGYLIGPVFGVVCIFVGVNIESVLTLNKSTLPCLFQIFAGLTVMLATACKFQETHDNLAFNNANAFDQSDAPNSHGVGFCVVTCFLIFNTLTVQEAIVTPIFTSNVYIDDPWPLTSIYAIYAGAALASIIALFFTQLVECVGERTLLLTFLLVGAGSWGLCGNYAGHISALGFITGFCLLSMSVAVSRNALFSVYSKMLGPNPAGKYMGVLVASGALARVLSPLWAVQFLAASLNFGVIVNGTSLLFAVIWLLLCWNKCRNHSVVSQDTVRFDFLYRPRTISNLKKDFRANSAH